MLVTFNTEDGEVSEYVDPSNIEDRADELEADGYTVERDDNYRQQFEDFDDPYDYEQYMEDVDTYGEAAEERYADIDSFSEDQYEGEWPDIEAYAQSYASDCGSVPDELWRVTDWEAYAEELLIDHSVYDVPGGVAIFSDY